MNPLPPGPRRPDPAADPICTRIARHLDEHGPVSGVVRREGRSALSTEADRPGFVSPGPW